MSSAIVLQEELLLWRLLLPGLRHWPMAKCRLLLHGLRVRPMTAYGQMLQVDVSAAVAGLEMPHDDALIVAVLLGEWAAAADFQALRPGAREAGEITAVCAICHHRASSSLTCGWVGSHYGE